MGIRAALAAGGFAFAAVQAQEAPLSDKQIRIAEELMAEALESDLGYELVEDLTTRVGQRLAGGEAEARARDWGVARLKELGFENVRVEPFLVEKWVRGVETGEIVSPFPQQLLITALGGSVGAPEGGVTAPIVRFTSLTELQQADRRDVEGKIAFIDERMTATMDGSGYGPANRKRRDAASVAGAAGAVAVLIRSVGTDSHRFPHTGSMNRYAEGVRKIPAAALSAPDADQLARALERADEVVVHIDMSPASLGEVESGNVIGEIPGRERPEEIVVIGGHLDSWDLGTGALDDGAGVGITTAAAKIILDGAPRPRRTIRLILWGSEEVGLIGARAYARDHADELENHVIGAESDFGARKIWRFDTRVAEAALPLADAIGAVLEPLGVNRGDNDAGGGPDVYPLRLAGVPVAGLQQVGLDYFDYHHTPDDTLDKIDPAEMRQNVAAYAAFAWLAADAKDSLRRDDPIPASD